MKIAVLSDIHSNVYALDAVIKDLQKHSVDLKANLGDILYGPVAPKSTYELLMEHDFITISGNQDRQIYESTQAEIDSNSTMQFILNDLGKSPLEWMKQLPFDLQVSPDIYACHGTPTDDLIYLLENISTGKAEVRTDHEIVKLLNGVKSPIVLCGHTHTPRCVELSTGQLIINPGSVGLQAYTDEDPNVHSMQNYSSKASYVTLLKDSDNKWKVDFHRVTYDISRAVDAAKNQGREDWVHYLSTGRCL